MLVGKGFRRRASVDFFVTLDAGCRHQSRHFSGMRSQQTGSITGCERGEVIVIFRHGVQGVGIDNRRTGIIEHQLHQPRRRLRADSWTDSEHIKTCIAEHATVLIQLSHHHLGRHTRSQKLIDRRMGKHIHQSSASPQRTSRTKFCRPYHARRTGNDRNSPGVTFMKVVRPRRQKTAQRIRRQ